MVSDLYCDQNLPPDDRGPFEDLDRIRIEMLNELPPEPAEKLFAGERVLGTPVLARLRFFRWMLHELYGSNIWRWEASLERRDERLRAVRRRRGSPVPAGVRARGRHMAGAA